MGLTILQSGYQQTMDTLVRRFLDTQRSYWKVILRTGREISEKELTFDFLHAGLRQRDWTLDLVSTGDVNKIKELWLICPPDIHGPRHAMIPIIEDGTAFQFKTKSVHAMGAWGSQNEVQVIGRVDDKDKGDCTCFIYDPTRDAMSTPYITNIREFGSFREGLAPIGGFSHPVLGLKNIGE